MIIKIEMEIKGCFECPFAERVYEMGYSGKDCMKLKPYSTTPKEGFRKDCPFLKNGG